MNTSDLLTIVAILLAPIVALQIQKFIEEFKERKERKMQIFRVLMATRATPLDPQHVQALNMIDIEFFNNKKVTYVWKQLLDNFSNYPQDVKSPDFQAKLSLCVEKSNDLLVELLFEMGQLLHYKFEKLHLKRGAYIPKGHADILSDQEIIRRSLVGVLSGQNPIPVKIINGG